jgi:hypothetical protein
LVLGCHDTLLLHGCNSGDWQKLQSDCQSYAPRYRGWAAKSSFRSVVLLCRSARNRPAASLTQSVDSQLASKGLTKTEGDNADLYVGYQVAVDQEKQWNAYVMGGGVRFGGMGTATGSTISVGTLVLDKYDLRANCR